MTPKMCDKLNTIVCNWRYGNKADAKKAIKNLTKVEIAQLLVNHYELPDGFCGQPATNYRFQNFVVDSLKW